VGPKELLVALEEMMFSSLLLTERIFLISILFFILFAKSAAKLMNQSPW
jgi:hypothetical protein